MSQSRRMPAVFIGHGSPMVALEDNAVSRAWAEFAAGIPRPTSILAISAHWETQVTAVTAMERPSTIHDFGASFPRALFDMSYPAPGSPALARRTAALLDPIQVVLDGHAWGLDHGTWSVLVHMYPASDIPVVQLSLDVNLRPEERLDIGHRLAPLRDEGVLILGTGNIVHNLPAMNWSDRHCAPFDWSTRFLGEIRDAILKGEPERVAAFARLGEDARRAAPTPEHFWPLLYVLGARQQGDRVRIVNDWVEHGSLAMTSFAFEDAVAARAAA
jgi:4,5-DOPA dioxygenase extradiol